VRFSDADAAVHNPRLTQRAELQIDLHYNLVSIEDAVGI
jgi:hypothetical protein